MKTPWDTYAFKSGQWQIIPGSIPILILDNNPIHLDGFLGEPMLIRHIRYERISFDPVEAVFEIKANGRSYGEWIVLGSQGLIPVTPPLFLTADAKPAFVVRCVGTPALFRVALDVERVVPL